MIKSKGWQWEIVKNKVEDYWKEPSLESYYLLNRWHNQNKKDFLDLGCGIGRHSVLFGLNGFNISCLDISEDGINKTKKWCESENIVADYKISDMLNLPYKDNSFDCILCFNVISHTDTSGIKKVISELKRVLKDDGEVYLTLCSKETWGFKQTDWPMVDANTKLRMDEGPEKGIPHFYADYELIKDLFSDFKIIKLFQLEEFYEDNNQVKTSFHYHLLIKK